MKSLKGLALCAAVFLLNGCETKGAPPAQGSVDNGSNANPQNLNCSPSEIPYQNQCYAQYLPCTAGGGSGQQEFINGAYSACVVNSCPAGNHVENGICVSNIKACAIANGTGEQQWNGSAYGACTRKTCNADYRADGNACLGPIVNIYRYRYQPGDSGLVDHYHSIIANDTYIPNATAEGIKLVLFKQPAGAATVALYSCDAGKNFTNFSITYTNVQCEYGGTPALLGYMAPAAQANGMNKAIHYCQMSAASYGFTGTDAAEIQAFCRGNPTNIIGYSF